MEVIKKKVGRKQLAKGEKKIQKYYYVKEKNAAIVAKELKKLLLVLDR